MSAELLIGEFRKPRQMLGDQEYDGHLSIHDDKICLLYTSDAADE